MHKYSRVLNNMPLKLLKFGHEVLSRPLAQFINSSIELGHFPEALNIGKIISLHKKRTAINVENYRPIILLSYIFKFTRKVISTRIYTFTELKNHFVDCKYCYRKKLSAELDCVDFVHLLISIERRYSTLLIETSRMQINQHAGKIPDCFNAYLSSRKIIITVSDERAEESEDDFL